MKITAAQVRRSGVNQVECRVGAKTTIAGQIRILLVTSLENELSAQDEQSIRRTFAAAIESGSSLSEIKCELRFFGRVNTLAKVVAI